MIDEGISKVVDKAEKIDAKKAAIGGSIGGGLIVSSLLRLFPSHAETWVLATGVLTIAILMARGAIRSRRKQREDLRQWLARHPGPGLSSLSPIVPESDATSRVRDRV